jgi:hypothetical protein
MSPVYRLVQIKVSHIPGSAPFRVFEVLVELTKEGLLLKDAEYETRSAGAKELLEWSQSNEVALDAVRHLIGGGSYSEQESQLSNRPDAIVDHVTPDLNEGGMRAWVLKL